MIAWLLVVMPLVLAALFWYNNWASARISQNQENRPAVRNIHFSKPRIYSKHGSKFSDLLHELPILHKDFTTSVAKSADTEKTFLPAWWAPFGFFQTVVREMFRSKPHLPWKREIIDFEDGGCIAIDVLEPEGCEPNSPTILFLPGITGSSKCSYIIHAAMEACRHGWRSVCVNPRGLGGVPLKTPRTYNAAMTDDFKHVVELVNLRYPTSKKMACGFSMGGMILWNYLAKCTLETAGLLTGMMISSPFNAFHSTRSLETFWPKLFFNSHLADCLKSVVKPYPHLFKDKLDWDILMKTNTIRDFDANFIVPMFGYKDWMDYYNDATLATKVDKIPIPVLALNSTDDVFAPIGSIPLDEITQSENIACVITEHGGHTSFMSRANPSDPGLVEWLLAEYGHMAFNKL